MLFYCSERFLPPGQKSLTVLRWSQVSLAKLTMSRERYFLLCLNSRVASNLSNLPYNALRREHKQHMSSLAGPIVYMLRGSTPPTCCKPLLGERESVAAPLQLHVHPRQRATFVHKLHRQGGGAGWAFWKLKLGPQGPGAWGSNTNTISRQQINQPHSWMNEWPDLKEEFRTSCKKKRKKMTDLHFQTCRRCHSTSIDIYFDLHS